MQVKDPDISFKYELPQKWKIYDDEYVYYIIPANGNDGNYISFTYSGEKGGESNNYNTDEIFKLKTEFVFPNNIPGFKIIETGTESIDGEKARWLKYYSNLNSNQKLNIHFIYIKYNMIFEILGTADSRNFEGFLKTYFDVAESFITIDKTKPAGNN